MIFRRKLRYVLVESTENVNFGNPLVAEELKKRILEFLGHLPYFKANPQVAAQLNEKVFIISMNRGYEREVMLALSFLKNMGGSRIGFYTVRTSGTIRSLKEAYERIYRQQQ
jgi:RNase P/RNase MRP subunit POP5